MNKSLVAFGTALAILTGALAPTTAAQAAPLAPSLAASNDLSSSSPAIEQVHRRRHAHRHGRHHGRPHRHNVRRHCYLKRVKVFSPYYGHYVWTTHEVCPRRGRYYR